MIAAPRPRLSASLAGAFFAEGQEDWEVVTMFADAAEAAGVDRLVMSDHVVFGENLEAYARPELGGVSGGRQPTGPDGAWLEPMTTLAVIAGRTRRVRLGTNILLAALRRPVVLAKAAATLDVLSGGRFDLGVGVGWQREEYVAAGLDFDRRGTLLDNTLEVCLELWRERSARVDRPELRFEGIHMMPKPLQPGGVPIWVSGRMTPRLVRRVVRYGSGWIPWDTRLSELPDGIARLRTALAEAGRDPGSLDVVGGLTHITRDDGHIDLDAFASQVEQAREAGATDLRILGWRGPVEPAALREELDAVVARFRSAVS